MKKSQRNASRCLLRLVAVVIGVLMLVFTDPGTISAQDNSGEPQLRDQVRQRIVAQMNMANNAAATCKRQVRTQVNNEKQRELHCGCFGSAAAQQASIQGLLEVGQQAMARCELKGLKVKEALLKRLEDEHVARMRRLLGQFQTQATAFDAWTREAQDGAKEAYAKITDMEVGAIAAELTAASTAAIEKRLDLMLDKAVSLRDPRRVRSTELKSFVLTLRDELRGKTRDEVKGIILARLAESRQGIRDFAGIREQLSSGIARAAVPKPGENPSGEALRSWLDASYSGILASVQFAEEHGSKAVLGWSRAAGVLGMAPDLIDTAAILYRTSVVGSNIEGLEQLRSAAEAERGRQHLELTVVVGLRRELEQQRQQFERDAKP